MDFNLSKCMKSVTHWGYDRVHNICTNTYVDVPWGWIDYFGWSFVSLTITVFCLGMMAVVIGVVMAIFDW